MGTGRSRPKNNERDVFVSSDPSLPVLVPYSPPSNESTTEVVPQSFNEKVATTSLSLPRLRGKAKLRPISMAIPPPQNPTKGAVEHLTKELQKLLFDISLKEGFSIEPVDDNIFKWNVSLFDFDENTQIRRDMDLYTEITGRASVMLEIVFPFHYPAAPPFIRVVYPRFHQYTCHITIGGSICVKDLTNAGWDSKNELLPFIIMIRNLLMEGSALIDLENLMDYTEAEAIEAFSRVAKAHGWSN